MPRIQKAYKQNFETLRQAFLCKAVALLDCQDKATKKPVRVVVALNYEPDAGKLCPACKNVRREPYDELYRRSIRKGYCNEQA